MRRYFGFVLPKTICPTSGWWVVQTGESDLATKNRARLTQPRIKIMPWNIALKNWAAVYWVYLLRTKDLGLTAAQFFGIGSHTEN